MACIGGTRNEHEPALPPKMTCAENKQEGDNERMQQSKRNVLVLFAFFREGNKQPEELLVRSLVLPLVKGRGLLDINTIYLLYFSG